MNRLRERSTDSLFGVDWVARASRPGMRSTTMRLAAVRVGREAREVEGSSCRDVSLPEGGGAGSLLQGIFA
ncbi:hypothetical protein GCM10023194_74550 [Planotetraspora phitsanulokensis]|uniref:Uncharacterized protein n=1 Tax=Planotetraspora phitsanulokensis TaxID=575192 RepID=A0A8J3U2J4_9ACTN|nr:hypothetical protein Pph01_20480 [Planotetraspora phitsanulokensis]